MRPQHVYQINTTECDRCLNWPLGSVYQSGHCDGNNLALLNADFVSVTCGTCGNGIRIGHIPNFLYTHCLSAAGFVIGEVSIFTNWN